MRPSAARVRYGSDGKAIARGLVSHYAATIEAESMLELGGAGDSARLLRQQHPGMSLVVAEEDQELWPLLRVEAQQHGYALVTGDFRAAQGKYDLIWLDLCAQWCMTTREAVADASRMLTTKGALAVTLLGAREVPEVAADRWAILPFLVSQAAGMRVDGLYRYRSGSPMWLFFLYGHHGPHWDADHAAEVTDRLGWYPFDLASISWAVEILTDLGKPIPLGVRQAVAREKRAMRRGAA